MECITKFKIVEHFRYFFLVDEQPYVQRIAAKAHVVLEQVGLVCCLP